VTEELDGVVDTVSSLGGHSLGERHAYPEGVVVLMADPDGTSFTWSNMPLASTAIPGPRPPDGGGRSGVRPGA
jgi:hypothetical protein